MSDLTEMYVLRTLDYRETSRLLYFYTAQGQVSALARGVKKLDAPYRHLAQTGHLLAVSFTKGRLPTVKEMQKIDLFLPIKKHLIAQTVTQIVQELIYYNMTESDDHLRLFGFLKKWLKTIQRYAEHETVPLELLMVFELKFLYLLGYGLRFNQCHVCTRQNDLYFEPNSGMIACAHHVENQNEALDAKQYAPLKWALHLDVDNYIPQNMTRASLNTLMHIMNGLHTMFLGQVPKAKQILHTLL